MKIWQWYGSNNSTTEIHVLGKKMEIFKEIEEKFKNDETVYAGDKPTFLKKRFTTFGLERQDFISAIINITHAFDNYIKVCTNKEDCEKTVKSLDQELEKIIEYDLEHGAQPEYIKKKYPKGSLISEGDQIILQVPKELIEKKKKDFDEQFKKEEYYQRDFKKDKQENPKLTYEEYSTNIAKGWAKQEIQEQFIKEISNFLEKSKSLTSSSSEGSP